MPERTHRAVVNTGISLAMAVVAGVVASALTLNGGAAFFLVFAILMVVLVLVPCLKHL